MTAETIVEGDAVPEGPLAGVKVLELAMWVFVPTCGAIMRQMGAEVIKV